jgi:hypothetical protein
MAKKKSTPVNPSSNASKVAADAKKFFGATGAGVASASAEATANRLNKVLNGSMSFEAFLADAGFKPNGAAAKQARQVLERAKARNFAKVDGELYEALAADRVPLTHKEKMADEVPLGGPLKGLPTPTKTPSAPETPSAPDMSGEMPSRGVSQQKLLEKILKLVDTPGLSPENKKILSDAASLVQNHDVEAEGTNILDQMDEHFKDGLPPEMKPKAGAPAETAPGEKPAPKPRGGKPKKGGSKPAPKPTIKDLKEAEEKPAPKPGPTPTPEPAPTPEPTKPTEPPAPPIAPKKAKPKGDFDPSMHAGRYPKVGEKLKLLRAGNIGKVGLGALAALMLARQMRPEQDSRPIEAQMEEARTQSRSARIAKAMEDMRMQRSIQQNQMRLAQANPTLYTSVMAGRRVPTNSVVLGGRPRTDLMRELAASMDSGRYAQQDPLSDLMG